MKIAVSISQDPLDCPDPRIFGTEIVEAGYESLAYTLALRKISEYRPDILEFAQTDLFRRFRRMDPKPLGRRPLISGSTV